MDRKNDTPGKGMSSPPQPNEVPLEICSYEDGQAIEFGPDDSRLYLVKSGTVQRHIQLPGTRGITPLELGKIQAGGYWQPMSTLKSAAEFNLCLLFVAQGKTVLLKLSDEGLPKDKDRLLVVFHSLLRVSAQQVSAAEAMIAHYCRLADQNAKEASSTRAQNALIESLGEELEDLQRQLGKAEKIRQGLERDLAASKAQLKASEIGRHRDRLEAASAIRQAQQRVADYSRWISLNFPDRPEVRSARSAVTELDVDLEINRMFDQIEAATKPFPLVIPNAPAIIKPQKAIFIESRPDEEPIASVTIEGGLQPAKEIYRIKNRDGITLQASQRQSEPPRIWTDSLMDDALDDFRETSDQPVDAPLPAPRARMETLSFEDPSPSYWKPPRSPDDGGGAPPLPSPPRK
jgi:hypothetical protein